jgi:hypothetical protein
MTGSERNDYNFPAPAPDFGGANDSLFGVVATLHNNVGLEVFDQIERCIFGKDYDEVDTFERPKHIGALGVAADRAGRPLEPSNGFVAVDADDQSIGGLPRGPEYVDVTGVKEVEYSIRERDPALSSRSPALGFNPGRNLLCRIARRQSLLAT